MDPPNRVFSVKQTPKTLNNNVIVIQKICGSLPLEFLLTTDSSKVCYSNIILQEIDCGEGETGNPHTEGMARE